MGYHKLSHHPPFEPLVVFQDVMCLVSRILGAGGYGSLAVLFDLRKRKVTWVRGIYRVSWKNGLADLDLKCFEIKHRCPT